VCAALFILAFINISVLNGGYLTFLVLYVVKPLWRARLCPALVVYCVAALVALMGWKVGVLRWVPKSQQPSYLINMSGTPSDWVVNVLPAAGTLVLCCLRWRQYSVGCMNPVTAMYTTYAPWSEHVRHVLTAFRV
jgi:hypothetical protein